VMMAVDNPSSYLSSRCLSTAHISTNDDQLEWSPPKEKFAFAMSPENESRCPSS
jgi:hypothetical protein